MAAFEQVNGQGCLCPAMRGGLRKLKRKTEMTIKTAAVVPALLMLCACNEEQSQISTQEVIAVSSELNSWLDADDSKAASDRTADTKKDVPPVGDMISGLESRLAANPDDGNGWSLLAQSYAFVGRMDDAKMATEKAVALGVDESQLQARVVNAHREALR